MEEIKGFFGKYRFLSNFYPSPLEYGGIEYPTVEHAYQAAKADNEMLKIAISNITTPRAAKMIGRDLNPPDWHERSLGTMEALVRIKFFSNRHLGEMLIATGDAYLEETNTWNDCFWGVCNGVGENHLGRILMKVRSEF